MLTFLETNPVNDLLNKIIADDASLTSVFFQCQPLTSSQVVKLADGLLVNTNLKQLSVLDCQLSDDDLRVLLPAILENHSLNIISIELPKRHPDPELRTLIADATENISQRASDAYKGIQLA